MKTFKVRVMLKADAHTEVTIKATEMQIADNYVRFVTTNKGIVAIIPLDKLVYAVESESMTD